MANSTMSQVRQPKTSTRAAKAVDTNVANRRDELVRVAARLFREKGFEGTTVRDIAAAVGMRSGSPFYHFANKYELLMTVMEEGLSMGLARIRAVLSATSLDPMEQLERLIRTQYAILHEAGNDFIPVILYEWRSLPDQYKRHVIELKDQYDGLWQPTLERLHAQNLLRADPKIARLLILGAINYSATWYKPARGKGRAGLSLDLDALSAQTLALVTTTSTKAKL